MQDVEESWPSKGDEELFQKGMNEIVIFKKSPEQWRFEGTIKQDNKISLLAYFYFHEV